MINVAANAPTHASELATLVREQLDDLVTYAAHLVGDADNAIEFVAGGVQHATKYPPVRIRATGRAVLYRAVTRACQRGQRYPPRPHGISRFLPRRRSEFRVEVDGEAASAMNTVKRSLAAVPFDRRAAILLRDLAHLSYRDIATALECSPENAARLVAAARRDFGTIYREIRL